MRGLPAVGALLEAPALASFEAMLGRATVKRAIERELDRARVSGAVPERETLIAAIARRLEREAAGELTPVINATGTLLHTNLGRAPLAREALAAVERFAHGYCNLEYDLDEGRRGSRYEHASSLICELTGAADALVVNNGAAAVLLALDTFAKGREVVVSRNQLVEIGGGFRVPDVIARSGARLVEVGTTNKVRIADFERALGPQSALLLRTHRSNFALEGFVEDVAGAELAALGRRVGLPVAEDLGSGALCDLAEYGLPHERTVKEALGDGIGLVAFSGDKLLGGPQCGIVAGSGALVARLRSNPLLRALRVDKMTLAALGATLRLHRSPESRARIPLYRMLGTTLDELRRRAQPYLAAMPGATLVESQARVGGGTLPNAVIASLAIAVATAHPDAFAAGLRRENPAIVPRVEDGRALFDLRTIAPEEDDSAIATMTYGAPRLDEA
ncbi:MAG TPA: L-seryl-tRNA(Sec) selenium transferase [Verrucomicrobiae bacterium]|nr:L-seryl-tRNA(Sec) selenium transferase [Verrucomicrobiae bacterium]